jgi:hypothetical protein
MKADEGFFLGRAGPMDERPVSMMIVLPCKDLDDSLWALVCKSGFKVL